MADERAPVPHVDGRIVQGKSLILFRLSNRHANIVIGEVIADHHLRIFAGNVVGRFLGRKQPQHGVGTSESRAV